MNVVLIGSGGREHALARGLVADPSVRSLVVAPGNPGIAALADDPVANPSAVPVRLAELDLGAPGAALAQSVAHVALLHQADLVVIGPETPLVAGAADAVRAAGIACFGPSAAAAQLEGSKAFAKQIMQQAKVPTADYQVCTTMEEVSQALQRFGPTHVVKADGLAAGKGVVVTTNKQQALDHARVCFSGQPEGAHKEKINIVAVVGVSQRKQVHALTWLKRFNLNPKTQTEVCCFGEKPFPPMHVPRLISGLNIKPSLTIFR